MVMAPEYVAQIKRLMEWEAQRKAPPAGFPHLPDIPAGRYTAQEYYDQFNVLSTIKYVVVICESDLPIACGAMRAIDQETIEIKRM